MKLALSVHLLGVDAEVLDHDLLYPITDIAHVSEPQNCPNLTTPEEPSLPRAIGLGLRTGTGRVAQIS